MSWERGNGSIEVELSRTQDWIEANDPKLNGNGRKGMIQQFWEDRSFIKGALWVIMLLGGVDFVVQCLQAAGILK